MNEHTLALGAMAEEMTKVIEINTQAISSLNEHIQKLNAINADLLEACHAMLWARNDEDLTNAHDLMGQAVSKATE